MAHAVVVFNNDETYLGKVEWQRAINLVLSGKADIFATLPEKVIRSINNTIMKFPLAIKLRFFVDNVYKRMMKIKGHMGKKGIRKIIYARDGYKCAYCNNVFNEEELTLDHILPQCRGGKDIFENLVTSCKPCNNKKDDKTPEEARMKLHVKAYKPSIAYIYQVRWMRMQKEIDEIKEHLTA